MAKGTWSLKCWRAGLALAAGLSMVFSAPQADALKSPGEPSFAGEQTRLRARKAVPAAAAQKAELGITTFPADGAILFRLDDPIWVRFTKPVKAEEFAFTVTPDPGGWRTAWSDGGRDVALEHRSFQAGADYVLAVRVAQSGNPVVERKIRFTAYGPSSLDLIDEAEKSERIGLDQAWTYRLQTIFEPSELPEAYRSVTPIFCGTPVLIGLEAARPRLRPETAAQLDRYLRRPTDPESVFGGRVKAAPQEEAHRGPRLLEDSFGQLRPTSTPGWFGVDSSLYPITVWSTGSAAPADAALVLLEGERMYGRFQDLMPFEPESDRDVRPDNGGDGRLDIYLVPRDPHLKWGAGFALGLTKGTSASQMTPCWIMINETLTGSTLGSVLAHELFHAFQLAADCKEPLWWLESTATWAIDFINTDWNFEHMFVPHAFDKTSHTLKTLTSAEGAHPYGAYLFPYYLSSAYGAEIIGELWTDCLAAGPNSLDAVRSRMESRGGFFKAFQEFALMNYNDIEPFVSTYPEELNVFPHHFEHRVLLKEEHSGVAFDLEPLSAVYIDVYNYGIDAQKTPSVVFDLTAFQNHSDIGIQAVVMHGDQEDVQDWTGQAEKLFCLESDGQRFDRVVIVVSSVATQETFQALDMPILLGRDPRCDADWIGTFNFTRIDNQTSSSSGSSLDVEEHCAITVNAVVRLSLKTVAKQEPKSEAEKALAEFNRLWAEAGGEVIYSQEPLDGSCTINFEHRTVETHHRPSYTITTILRASCASPLIVHPLSASRGPRLTVDSKKGTYSLEIFFFFQKCIGESIVDGSRGRTTHPWELENLQPLFDSHSLRTKWNEPALKGSFEGDVIRGSWTAPSRPREWVKCSQSALDGVTVSWEIRRVKQ